MGGSDERHVAVRLERWVPFEEQKGLMEIKAQRQKCSWLGLVFGGVAMPNQDKVHHNQDEQGMSEECKTLLGYWASLVARVCDVVVTSVSHSDSLHRGEACSHGGLSTNCAGG